MKKPKVLKSWSRHNLPEDLWPEILSRLPVKSLLRFRCVCRSWKAWIDDPDFTRINNRSQSQILFVSLGGECVVKNSQTLRTTSSLGFLQSDLVSPDFFIPTSPATSFYGFASNCWYVSSSCDGFFLLCCGAALMLWNPSVRTTLRLFSPGIPLLEPKHYNSSSLGCGLGFDPLVRDYKAVKFVLLPEKGVQFALVYTLTTKSWKLVECPTVGRKDLDFRCWQSSISFNGVLYGLATDYLTGIIKLASFDLTSEVFTSFELPVTEVSRNSHLTIIDDGSSLALIHLCDSILSMWVLEGLGDDTKVQSWIQHCTLTIHPGESFLCIKKNGEMLMKLNNMVVCYNLQTQQRKIFMKNNKKKFEEGNTVAYMESLVMHC